MLKSELNKVDVLTQPIHETKLAQTTCSAGKVYFIEGHYDVKLQADNRVRWDVVLRD